MRPRDLILLCNHCKDIAENHNLKKIDEDSILNGLSEYSLWKLNDLRDEYQVQYPFLDRLFWNVFYDGKLQIDRQNISEKVSQYEKRWKYEIKDWDQYFIHPNNLISILFEIGFLGAIKMGREIYFYSDIQVSVADIKYFVIHPAFRKALNVKETLGHPQNVESNNSNENIRKRLYGDSTTDAPPPPSKR